MHLAHLFLHGRPLLEFRADEGLHELGPSDRLIDRDLTALENGMLDERACGTAAAT